MINSIQASICPGCGAANTCAVARGEQIEQCWCSQSTIRLPLPVDTTLGCYCPACLQQLIAAARTEANS